MSGTIWADPGGEFYFSLGNVIAAPGLWTTSNNTFGGSLSLSNSGPVGRQAATDGKVYAIASPGGGVGANMTKTFTAASGRMIAGKAFYVGTTSWSANSPLIAFFSVTNQSDIRTTDIAGHVSCSRSNGTLYGATSTLLLSTGWHYYELDVTFATGATGTSDFWVDGVRWIHNTAVQTSGATTCNQVNFYNPSSAACFWKDLYVTDGTTGPYGDITVAVKYPNVAGVNSQWAASSGTALSTVQDGITHTGTWPDGDTSYILDSTTNDISDFGHETLTLTGAIKSIVHVSYMRKDDAGSRQAAQVCLSTGTTEVGTVQSLGNTYTYYQDFLDTDPHTSSAWSLAGFNAATFGVKEIT